MFFNMTRTFGRYKPIGLKFSRVIKHAKIFDKCPGVFQNLDQGPDGVPETVFPKYGKNFGMEESRDLKFCREVKHQKIFDNCPGIYRNLDQGSDGVSKTVFPKYG